MNLYNERFNNTTATRRPLAAASPAPLFLLTRVRNTCTYCLIYAPRFSPLPPSRSVFPSIPLDAGKVTFSLSLKGALKGVSGYFIERQSEAASDMAVTLCPARPRDDSRRRCGGQLRDASAAWSFTMGGSCKGFNCWVVRSSISRTDHFLFSLNNSTGILD